MRTAEVVKPFAAGPRPRRRPAATAAAAAATATPLPLLPFFDEFRSQLARLEGVAALPVPPQFAAATSVAPPVGMQSGACHADRLRFGHFMYVNAGPLIRQRGRPRGSSSSGTGKGVSSGGGSSSSGGGGGGQGCVSLLQGELLPSLFSFQPPLAFQVAAFNGSADWMIAVEYVPLQSSLDAVGVGSEDSNGGCSGVQACAALAQVEAWQAQQAQRLAALRGMYARAAAPEPAPARRPPARLLLSSAALQGEAPVARRAALEGAGLSAFRAALSVHLNGLAAAPADASPAHVARSAAAQRQLLAASAAHPPLCTAQLAAAFGQRWVAELQQHLLLSRQQGLEVAALQGGRAADQQQQQQAEFVYFAPRRLLSSSDDA
ncbi:hypothetical protein ABPG75_004568 [Micractinium tetrahymenae]